MRSRVSELFRPRALRGFEPRVQVRVRRKESSGTGALNDRFSLLP